MAQFYTLEEAARVLGMDPEVLKAKANANEIRPYRDGATLRFKVADIDEFARIKGLGSEPELHLSDLDIPAASSELSEFELNAAGPNYGATMEFTPRSSGSDHDLLIDDLSVPPNPITGSSSVILGMGAGGKHPSDSDVRLVPDEPKGASDSDVRVTGGYKAPSDSDVTLIADDTSSHEALEAASSGDTAVRQSPLLGSSGEIPADSGSDFELTPSSVIDALQPDSGSDFELSAIDEGSSDEFESTPLKRPSDSDVTAGEPGLSGINLSKPSDSGINLQMASGLNLGQSIELTPLSGESIPTAPKAKATPKAPAAGAGPKGTSKVSLSETPVPGVGKGDKDIFDDTDFEVDALSSDSDDSDDKTMQLEAASDFELEESDTGSEVFAIDEEDVDQNASTSIGSSLDLGEDDDDDADEFGEGTSGEMSAGAWDVESESPSAASSSPSRATPAAMMAAGPSPEWGGVVIGMLGVTTVFMLFLAFVTMDLVRNLYDYHQDGPASGIVKSIAGMIGG